MGSGIRKFAHQFAQLQFCCELTTATQNLSNRHLSFLNTS